MKLPSPWAKSLPDGGFEMVAPAKINWTLNIVGQRADGYHLLDSLMQPLALQDRLIFSPARELTLKIEGTDELIADHSNLVIRAAICLQKAANVDRGAHIVLKKYIPMGAGLGGGSADAAATLRGLCRLWNLDLEEERLYEIGMSLGADVPFCLLNAPARARGIGERLTPFACRKCFPLILIQPCGPLSTRDVFAAWHQSPGLHAETEAAMAALARGDLTGLAQAAHNALESVSVAMRPEIGAARRALLAQGAGMAQMSGSGSVVFGAFEKTGDAQNAWETLRKDYPVCLLTHTADGNLQ